MVNKRYRGYTEMISFYIAIAIITALLMIWLYNLSMKVQNISVNIRGRLLGFFALGTLAYLLGLRHGLDADHLAAIDNSTRKLVQEGKNARWTGTFFSLGHSTVVILLSAALMVATRYIISEIPTLENIGSIMGTLISGVFLYIIGLLNFLVFFEIYEIFKRLRSGELDEARLNELLLKRGFLARYFNPLFKIVDRAWYMYPIGFLFGLGFDTASETALLAISAASAGVFKEIPLWNLLVFPFLFTAGMVLVDTTDGFFMSSAYGWAFSNPLRKVWYNLTMTIISVMVAWVVGTLELLGLIQSEFNLSGPFWDWIAWINSDYAWGMLGVFIIAIFAVTWTISIAVYKLRGYKVLAASQPPAQS